MWHLKLTKEQGNPCLKRCIVSNREVVGRTALLNFLSSNHDVLGVCIDQCYSRDAAVARAYFQVRIASSTWQVKYWLSGASCPGAAHVLRSILHYLAPHCIHITYLNWVRATGIAPFATPKFDTDAGTDRGLYDK